MLREIIAYRCTGGERMVIKLKTFSSAVSRCVGGRGRYVVALSVRVHRRNVEPFCFLCFLRANNLPFNDWLRWLRGQ